MLTGEWLPSEFITMRRATDEAESRITALALRKANDVVAVRVKQGKLTLLSRKLFNVMLAHAQLLKEPGKNAPRDFARGELYFWVPLSTVVADSGFNSHDTLVLQESAQSIQGVQVVLEDQKQWRSEALVASVVLAYPDGKGQGKTVWFGWAFPPGVHDIAVRPSVYTQLSLYYQQLFRRDQTLALYEICRQYATSPGKRTPAREFRWWFHQLSGRPVNVDPPQFKYWKRDELRPAVAEVNALSDIEIEPVEKRVGRRVDSLYFKTQLKAQESLSLGPPPLIDSSLREPIMALGVSQRDADQLLRDFDATKIRAAIDLMSTRNKNKKLAPISSPKAWLQKVLKNGLSEQPMARQGITDARSEPDPEASSRELNNQFTLERSRQALATLKEMDAKQRQEQFDEYLPSAPASLRTILRDAGPLSKVADGFHQWYAQKVWGPPTQDELLQFAAQRLAVAEDTARAALSLGQGG